MPSNLKSRSTAWVVAVSMGFGHQRTAHPLRGLSPTGAVINANDYDGMPPEDRARWEQSRRFYEYVSNIEHLPYIGKLLFGVFDLFQRIIRFYPRQNSVRPTLQLRQNFSLFRRGFGKHFIGTLATRPASPTPASPNRGASQGGPLPLVSTFFTPAYMAEFFHYPGDIYCVVCDTDISRTWASLDAASSRIRYFATTDHAAERLTRYGVNPNQIFMTGYPLPKENIGTRKLEIAKHDLGHRLVNLDPHSNYRKRYTALIKEYVGALPQKPDHPLTIMFSIGGAGAQKNIALSAIRSLSEKINNGALRFVVAAGTKDAVRLYFNRELMKLGLGDHVRLVSARDVGAYFDAFNAALRTTDILWTKPSELTFYAGLGIPIIIAPPIGSQEEFNRDWLIKVGAGILQEDPAYAAEWIADNLESGAFAEAAMQGFVEIEKRGTFMIEEIVAQSSKVLIPKS